MPGHWEGDLIVGLGSSAIGTLVERTTRFTMLLHLPRMDGHGDRRGSRTVPHWLGTGPKPCATRSQFHSVAARALRPLLDLGPGRRDGATRATAYDTGLLVFFCDPHITWQRGRNENTNGLLL